MAEEKRTVLERIHFARDCRKCIIGDYKTDLNDAEVELDVLLLRFNTPSARFFGGHLLEPERVMRESISLFCFKDELTTAQVIERMKEAQKVPASMREAASFLGRNRIYEAPSRIVILEGTKDESKIFPFLVYKRIDGVLVCNLKASLEEDVWAKGQIFMGVPE